MEIEILKNLKGLSIKDIYEFICLEREDMVYAFRDYETSGYTRGKMIEYVVNLLNSKHNYDKKKGPDFGKYELKCITIVKNCIGGDTPISMLDRNNFEKSNVIEKIKNVIIVVVKDLKIVDIRLFNYEEYKNELINDWNNITGETKYLRLKMGKVFWKKNKGVNLIDLSLPIGIDNDTENPIEYLKSMKKEKSLTMDEMIKLIEAQDFKKLYDYIK